MNNVINISLRVNGRNYELNIEGNERLIDVLRDRLGFKSVKEGCGSGDCGLCIVLMNGKPVHSCMVMGFQAREKEITTVEHLGDEDNLHPIQKAFTDVGAVQCGYCIPAAILVSKHILENHENPTQNDIRWFLRSVLCRCGSYLRFEKAIYEVSQQVR